MYLPGKVLGFTDVTRMIFLRARVNATLIRRGPWFASMPVIDPGANPDHASVSR